MEVVNGYAQIGAFANLGNANIYLLDAKEISCSKYMDNKLSDEDISKCIEIYDTFINTVKRIK